MGPKGRAAALVIILVAGAARADEAPVCGPGLVAVNLWDNYGASEWQCVPRTADGGRRCTRSSDCELFCLASTHTCLPTVQYHYGGDYLDYFGRVADGGRFPLRLSCEGVGGSLAFPGSSGAPYCDIPSSDGGQPCASARDCEGVCVAATRTCTGSITLQFCGPVLDENGVEIDGRAFSICF